MKIGTIKDKETEHFFFFFLFFFFYFTFFIFFLRMILLYSLLIFNTIHCMSTIKYMFLKEKVTLIDRETKHFYHQF